MPQQYPYVSRENLKWTSRYPRIMNSILEHECDVVCLQEVEAFSFEHSFAPQLFEYGGYVGVFEKRPKAKKNDGCAIFWRQESFQFKRKETWNFNRVHADLLSSGEEDLRKCQTNNIAMAVLLEDKRSWRNSNKVWVVNSHLFWDPIKRDVKLIQAKMLLRFISKLVSKENAAVVFCGDLNSMPGSEVYRCFVEGKDLPPGIQLKSAFADQEPEHTNYTTTFKACIDYIWFSSTEFIISTRSSIPSADELSIESALPNSEHPSDHIPLFCELQYKPKIFSSQIEHKSRSAPSTPQKCRHGVRCKNTECKFLHPHLCRFGIHCESRNKGCWKVHVIPCRDGLDCQNVSCTYAHLPCKFGMSCTNDVCIYSHSFCKKG